MRVTTIQKSPNKGSVNRRTRALARIPTHPVRALTQTHTQEHDSAVVCWFISTITACFSGQVVCKCIIWMKWNTTNANAWIGSHSSSSMCTRVPLATGVYSLSFNFHPAARPADACIRAAQRVVQTTTHFRCGTSLVRPPFHCSVKIVCCFGAPVFFAFTILSLFATRALRVSFKRQYAAKIRQKFSVLFSRNNNTEYSSGFALRWLFIDKIVPAFRFFELFRESIAAFVKHREKKS